MKSKRLIIIAGAKGGSGKSLTATILHAWLVARKHSDGGHRRRPVEFPPSPAICRTAGLSTCGSRQPLMPSSHPSPPTKPRWYYSTHGQPLPMKWWQWLKQIGIEAIKTDLSTAITVVVMVTNSRDTLEQLRWWKEELKAEVQWVIVRNHGRRSGGRIRREQYSQGDDDHLERQGNHPCQKFRAL